MYMYKNKKIIICKFNLKKKCQFGDKCKYRHISVNELNNILASFIGLKEENESLKSVLKDKCRDLSNMYKKSYHVTDYNAALTKPLYNSFFENSESLNERERREMVQSEESGIDEDINEKVVNHLSELQSKARNTKNGNKLTNNQRLKTKLTIWTNLLRVIKEVDSIIKWL